MSQQIINISTPDDGLGDVLRNGFDKTNQNFTELYNGKVDKVIGKGLSENDFTDADKSKLDGIEDGAEVNVQSDWLETDPAADSFILNKPPSLNSAVGYFHYADLATQTTPISVVANTETILTNDAEGDRTFKDQAPYGVSDVWFPSAFDFSQLSVGDTLDLRVDLLLTTTSVNQKYKVFLRFADGLPEEFDLEVCSGQIKTVASDIQIIGEIGFSIDLSTYISTVQAIYIISDDTASVKVNGWYIRVLRKSVNVIDFTSDPLKQDVLTPVNFGEFMDLELPTKLTPSPNDTILGRDFLTNEAVEFNYPIVEGYFNGTNFYLESGFINLITATTGRTYVNLSTNLQYRWSGSAYVQIGGGEQNIEVITLQNRWTLTNLNIYYRSRFDYAGFNDAIMNYSAGASSYATLTQIQRSQSSFFYCAIGNKKLHKIIVDVGSIGATITSYTLMIVACKRVSTNSNNTSTINGINLGEYNMTKADGNLNDFHIIIPNDVTIPDGYIVTCYLKRYDGATNEINCSIMFQFKNA